MTIYLQPEIPGGSSLGEDTFWTWFKREIPNSEFFLPSSIIQKNDIILRYSTLGKCDYPDQTICLLWELYPEMKMMLNDNQWDNKINSIQETLQSSKRRVIATEFAREYYSSDYSLDYIPIGINCELFKPISDKFNLRKKYGIPSGKKIGIWVGTSHPMKGFDKLVSYKNNNPEIHWILVWKKKKGASLLPDCTNFIKVDQIKLNELFNCSDFFLSTSRLRPYYMTEYEAMASNLKIKFADDIIKDFKPSDNPRDDIFKLGWDRQSTKEKWLKYLDTFYRD